MSNLKEDNFEDMTWEEEFDDRFKDEIIGYDEETSLAGMQVYEDIKSFLSSKLDEIEKEYNIKL